MVCIGVVGTLGFIDPVRFELQSTSSEIRQIGTACTLKEQSVNTGLRIFNIRVGTASHTVGTLEEKDTVYRHRVGKRVCSLLAVALASNNHIHHARDRTARVVRNMVIQPTARWTQQRVGAIKDPGASDNRSSPD